jgi:VanZ family protein
MAIKEEIKQTEKKLESEVKKHPFTFWWDPVILYFIAIMIISNWHTTPTPEKAILGFVISDKIKHVILYFGFSLLLGMACRHSRFTILRENHYFVALTVASLIGILDELNQLHVVGRHMGIDEIFLNITGAITGQIARFVLKLEKRWLDRIF